GTPRCRRAARVARGRGRVADSALDRDYRAVGARHDGLSWRHPGERAGAVMALELRILGGARAGRTLTFQQTLISVGRDPASDLRFDAGRDLDVSAAHAEI